ncbi:MULTISPECIES: ribosome maturation factor RimP [Carnobacterium]|uniref:Ribosome maturation factor RimP n=1 Tax=Carnobacterium divergens TaxID=2748 RepID=A0A2R7ZZR7_CARDV|nr:MULTISPECIES: ribosome maturation factor RimP [Carnobacterium]MCO6017917.1 ribosome maturation factor RimP [Carnobacterium divergens]MDT1938726.1 ribosome maturation factor RimP [Carnobacterium divergens]MDT1941164.1 ribosome maturation factor RimP [Carnobacterium divergens]MDT1946962.1 ribosome maturation factor RimP [Carnobacterium divergens]MDT1949399.1 ribosome maturation factor RimP [Carnobacterium divergens]
MSNVVDTVKNIVQPIVDEFQFELVDVEFVKEGKNWFLRTYIDKPGGIDIEECALISEKISERMDQIDPDPIPQAYFLEVSSPGAERPLKKEADYQNAIGSYINISLYEPVEGQKVYEGTLKELTEETLTLTIRIKTREKEIEFNRKKIAKARLAIKF